MSRKGSITVYLSLILVPILALVCAGIMSAKTAAGRFACANAVDQGMYSLFAQYDRDLLAQYHLFFVDGGYSTGEIQFGKIYQVVEDAASYVTEPEKGIGIVSGHGLLNISQTGGSITGYMPATLEGGVLIKEQAVEYMKKTLGAQGVQLLLGQLNSDKDTLDEQEKNKTKVKNGEGLDEADEVDLEGRTADKDMDNPITAMNDLRKRAIQELVLQDSSDVSSAAVSAARLPSGRTLTDGMGVVQTSSGDMDATDAMLFQEYLMKVCGSYVNPKDGALKYQIEYILKGKESDRDNLSGVIDELMLMREAANTAHIYLDPSLRAQALSMASNLSIITFLPEAVKLYEIGVILAWAFAESILDVRNLMAGDKVPLVKTPESWQLSLYDVPKLAGGLDTFRRPVQTGMNYAGYLRLMLFLRSSESKQERFMDIIESTICAREGREDFHLDTCLSSLEVEMEYRCESRVTFTVRRNYQYRVQEVYEDALSTGS